MMKEELFDICIIGAGVAGGTLAAYLGKHGMKVCVVEKSFVEQERIVGELLQPGGVMKLQEMGLEHLLKGFDAQPVYGYGLFLNGDKFQIPYSSDKENVVRGFGFRNHKFVGRIRTYLETLPSVTLLEGTVTELLEEGEKIAGVKYYSKEGQEERTIRAKLTVVCDGMFSLFRDGLSVNEKKVSSYFMGLVLKDCPLPYPNHGHVVVAKPSPCLIYPISSSETRILIDFPQQEAPRKSPELTTHLRDVILPQLPSSIQPAFLAAVEEGKLKVMPNQYFPAKPKAKAGAVLIGDSLNMRHPLTGGGMTVAFTDIKLLGDLLIASEMENPQSALRNPQSNFDDVVKEFYKNRHKENATINILADALYGVMRNEDLKVACYDYLKRGGAYAEEPVSLLSAISRDRQMLLRHFFAVAMYGIKNLPNKQRLRRSQRMLHDAVDIVSPLVLNEKPGFLTKYAFKASQAIF
jgi:squalene monooxygenase